MDNFNSSITWTQTLDPDPEPWTRILDPDPGPVPWTRTLKTWNKYRIEKYV